jgi:hypothetical protein
MKNLDKRAKEVILAQMEELGEVTKEAVVELIRPHYIFDACVAREREIGKKANSLMAQFRDEHGARICYNYNDDGQSKYINVDTTKNLRALNGVEKQLNNKFYGLNQAKKKVEHRQLELSGQMELFDKEATQ